MCHIPCPAAIRLWEPDDARSSKRETRRKESRNRKSSQIDGSLLASRCARIIGMPETVCAYLIYFNILYCYGAINLKAINQTLRPLRTWQMAVATFTLAPLLTTLARDVNKPRLQIRALRRAGCRWTARFLRAPTPTSVPKTRFARNGPQAISPTYRGVCLHHDSESRRDVSASLKRRYSSATQRVSCRSCYLARGLVCHVILSHAPKCR